MNRNEKEAAVAAYKQLFDGIDSVVLADTSSVSVNTINEVRSKFRAEGVTFRVIKNSLAKKALIGTVLEPVCEKFHGPVAVALKLDDPIAPARVICEFAKKNKNVVKIKGGMVEGKVLSVEELMSFGELPSKNALVAQVLGTFLAPISSLAVVLNQILEQKGGAPAEEAPAEA